MIDFNNPNSLSTLHMIGSLYREEMKKQGINLDKIFEKCMEETKDIEDPIKRLQVATEKYTLEMLKTMPLENRCNFVLNKITKAKDDNVDEKSFNWERINEMLFNSPLKYDFNLYDSVSTVNEITELLMTIREREIFGGGWYKQKCKTCGEIFYLDKSEIVFYIEKDLHIPKRCKNCIMESKGQESYRQKKIREEKERENVRKQFLPESKKSIMQEAIENAMREKKG